jgi:hypothetical protein
MSVLGKTMSRLGAALILVIAFGGIVVGFVMLGISLATGSPPPSGPIPPPNPLVGSGHPVLQSPSNPLTRSQGQGSLGYP